MNSLLLLVSLALPPKAPIFVANNAPFLVPSMALLTSSATLAAHKPAKVEGPKTEAQAKAQEAPDAGPPSAEVIRRESRPLVAKSEQALSSRVDVAARREQLAAAASSFDSTDRILIEIFNAVHNKNWLLLVALLASLFIQGVKKGTKFLMPVSPRLWAWLNTDRGGVTLTLATGLLSALSATLLVGKAITLQLVMDAVHYGVVYAGGYVTVKKLFFPSGADRAQCCQQLGENVGAATEAKASSSAAAAAQALNDVGTKPPA